MGSRSVRYTMRHSIATALQWEGRRSTGAELFDASRAWLYGLGSAGNELERAEIE